MKSGGQWHIPVFDNLML